MRSCVTAFAKTILGLAVLTLFFVLHMAATTASPQHSSRLEQHVRKVASAEHNTPKPPAPEEAALYIELTLAAMGYEVTRRQYSYAGRRVRKLEASIVNTRAAAAPERIFIVGAHYDCAQGTPGANDNGSGTAAVIELARMLKDMRLSEGTELKFVFFVNEEPPRFGGEGMGRRQHAKDLRVRRQPVEGALVLETTGDYARERDSQRYLPGLEKKYPSTGNFIAFVGTLESSELVRKTLASFKAASTFPAAGLAAPAYVEGVTLSDHTAYTRHGYPALVMTDTAFLRYPYYHTAHDTPDKLDYAGMARVVDGLAKVIEAMAGPKQM